MEEKFINIDNLSLAFIEKNPNAHQTIFFIHGNSGSASVWQNQLSSGLFNNYRLISLDLPGHGQSSHSNNPAEDYSPIRTAKILAEAVKKLANDGPYIMIGFSYGTNVVAEMLNYGIHPKGIIFVASCVIGIGYGMEMVFVQNETPPIVFYNETNQKIIEKRFAKELNSATKQDLQNLVDAYLKVDPDFKPALFKSANEGKVSDEILALQKCNVQVCVVFGAKDRLVNIDYLDDLPFPVWQNHIYKLPQAGHWLMIESANVFNKIASEYAAEVFKSTHV